MRGKPFQRGNPGGPGRPKGSSYVERCRDWANRKGWKKLESWADGRNPRLALEATKIIVAYGYGKPREAIEPSEPEDRTPIKVKLTIDKFNNGLPGHASPASLPTPDPPGAY